MTANRQDPNDLLALAAGVNSRPPADPAAQPHAGQLLAMLAGVKPASTPVAAEAPPKPKASDAAAGTGKRTPTAIAEPDPNDLLRTLAAR